MKKERIMVDGIKYRYIINDSNEIELNKEVSKEVFDRIKEILIKKGKYSDQKIEWPEIPYEEVDLKERFKRWAKVELKIYKEELEKEKGSEKLIRAIDEEIERREKNDNERTRRLLEKSKDENQRDSFDLKKYKKRNEYSTSRKGIR